RNVFTADANPGRINTAIVFSIFNLATTIYDGNSIAIDGINIVIIAYANKSFLNGNFSLAKAYAAKELIKTDSKVKIIAPIKVTSNDLIKVKSSNNNWKFSSVHLVGKNVNGKPTTSLFSLKPDRAIQNKGNKEIKATASP